MAEGYLKFSGHTLAPIEMRRFSGDFDPTVWVFQAERYFNFHGFSKDMWLSLSYLYFDGEALAWFNWLYRNNQFYDWKHFTEKLACHYSNLIAPEIGLSPITDILLKIDEIQSRMCRHLDNFQNTLSTCTQKFANAQARSDVTASSADKCEPEEVPVSDVASDLDDGNSHSIYNSDIPSEMYEPSIGNFSNTAEFPSLMISIGRNCDVDTPIETDTVEEEKLEDVINCSSIGNFKPLIVPIKPSVDGDIPIEVNDDKALGLVGSEHHLFDGFPQTKDLVPMFFHLTRLHVNIRQLAVHSVFTNILWFARDFNIYLCEWYDTGQYPQTVLPFNVATTWRDTYLEGRKQSGSLIKLQHILGSVHIVGEVIFYLRLGDNLGISNLYTVWGLQCAALRNITQYKSILINSQERREKPVSHMNSLIYIGDTLLSSNQMPYYLVFRIVATLHSSPISDTYFQFCLRKILLLVYQKGPDEFKSSGGFVPQPIYSVDFVVNNDSNMSWHFDIWVFAMANGRSKRLVCMLENIFTGESIGLLESCPFLEVTPETIKSAAQELLIPVRPWGERARYLSTFLCDLELIGEHTIAPLSFYRYCEQNLTVVSQNMEEKNSVAKLGKITGSSVSGLASAIPLNYRAFLCWFAMLKMLNDSLLWSNYIYMGASGGLWPGAVKSLCEDLLEFKLTIFCRVLRVANRMCTNVMNTAVGGSLRKFLCRNAYNYKLWKMEKGRRECATTFQWVILVFDNGKSLFSGCIHLMLSAPTLSLVHANEFLKAICCCSWLHEYVSGKAITNMEMLHTLLTGSSNYSRELQDILIDQLCYVKIAAFGSKRCSNQQHSYAFITIGTVESNGYCIFRLGVHHIQLFTITLWSKFTGFLILNLEDKVLIEDGGIVMNPVMDFVDQTSNNTVNVGLGPEVKL